MKQIKRAIYGIGLLLLVGAMLCGTAFADVDNPSGGTFSDVPANASYMEAVEFLREMGIFAGDDKGNFNPNQTITRAETAAVFCRMMGVEESAITLTQSPFYDVPSGHWAVGYIAKAAELGVVNGYGNGQFGPSNPVTYQEVLKMLVCSWGWGSLAEEAGGWPNGYITVATESGYTEGINFNPADNATRAAVAQLIYNSIMG